MAADLGRIWSFEPSPDGTRMLVSADGSGRRQPWLVPLDGSAVRMIAIAGSVQRCVWHPDGSRFIAVVDPDGREDNQLTVVDSVTGAAEPIAAPPGVRNELGDPDDVRRLVQASPITHAERVRAPILLIHGTHDTRVSIESSDALYARLIELGKNVIYERIDGAGHEIGQQHTGIETVICDWLVENLLH